MSTSSVLVPAKNVLVKCRRCRHSDSSAGHYLSADQRPASSHVER